MTFKENFVVVVKCGGKVLREIDSTVTLPFGSEYSILIKNLNSVRAQVKVSVDGIDATESTHLVIAPNSDIELERFIRNGNLLAGNRFKFIERTDQIETHRGAKVDDGLIRVEAWAERVQPVLDVPIIRYYERPIPYWHGQPPVIQFIPVQQWPWDTQPWCNNTASYGAHTGNSGKTGVLRSANFNVGAQISQDSCDAGITVPGSESSQTFHTVSGFPLEFQSRVIVLRLRGQVGRVLAAKAVTVKYKPKCTVCGHVNKSRSKFCGNCGAARNWL
jgi:hypothetical protein